MDLTGQMTQHGAMLRAMALMGQTTLRFTRAAAGSGFTAANASVLDAEQQSLPIGAPRYTSGSAILPVTLAAALAETAYSLTELGLYVQDGEEELLYCIYRASEPLSISPTSSMSIRFSLEEAFSPDSSVSVSPGGLVTEPDLESLMGAPDGIATLDADAVVPVAQMPYSYGAEDLDAGETPLKEGRLHFVYEE